MAPAGICVENGSHGLQVIDAGLDVAFALQLARRPRIGHASARAGQWPRGDGVGYRHVLRRKDIFAVVELLSDWGELSTGLEAVVLARGRATSDGWHRADPLRRRRPVERVHSTVSLPQNWEARVGIAWVT